MPTVCPVSAEVPTEELRDKVTLCAEEPLEDFCGRHSDRTTRVNTIKLCPLCQPGRQNVPWGTSRASVPLALGRCEWIQSGSLSSSDREMQGGSRTQRLREQPRSVPY